MGVFVTGWLHRSTFERNLIREFGTDSENVKVRGPGVDGAGQIC
jgi:hypothetical protein